MGWAYIIHPRSTFPTLSQPALQLSKIGCNRGNWNGPYQDSGVPCHGLAGGGSLQSLPHHLPLLLHWLSPFILLFKLPLAFSEQLVVHVGQHLPRIQREVQNRLVPVALGVPLYGWNNERHDHLTVLGNHTNYVIVVPKEKGPLCNLRF